MSDSVLGVLCSGGSCINLTQPQPPGDFRLFFRPFIPPDNLLSTLLGARHSEQGRCGALILVGETGS